MSRVTLPEGWTASRVRRDRPGEDVLACYKHAGFFWWSYELAERHGPFDTLDLAIADAEKCNP